MSKEHKIGEVEHLSAIAEANGFFSNRPIWEHARNAALRDECKSPHLLIKDKILFIPDKIARVEKGATGKDHRFIAKRERIQLHVRLLDRTDKPVAGAEVDIRAGSQVVEKQTGGDGKVKTEIPRSTVQGRVIVFGEDGDRTKPPLVEYSLRVGALYPLDRQEGWIQRLNNLGYSIPPQKEDRDKDEVQSAIEEFQCDHGLKVTGKPDGPTRSKLLEVYGG